MQLDGLIPLADFTPPSLPTEERFHVLWNRAKAMLMARSNQNVIAEDRLETPSLRRLDEAAHPPACAPLLNDLDQAMKAWLDQPVSPGTVLAVIVQPTDRHDIVGSWAASSDLTVIEPPPKRSGPLDLDRFLTLPEDVPIAVPQLERWFLRTPEGVDRMRQLITFLSMRRRVLIGCNSFAWAFLTKAIGLDLIAPGPFTFRPFDGPALEEWLVDLAGDEIDSGTGFRFADSGGYLLREGAEKETRHFFETLAGRSRGAPSIAWHMWRDMLRLDDLETQNAGTQGQQSRARETFWVASLEELVLPGDYPRELLFALHSLCLHGRLTPEELTMLVPGQAGAAMIPALRGSKFVRFEDGELAIRPEAYPAVRSGLRASGFPLGIV